MGDVWKAIRKGDPDAVIEMVRNSSVNANAVSKKGLPLLHTVLTEGLDEEELVKALLDAGANVNLPDKDGNSALHWAVRMCEPEVTQMLLNKDDKVMHGDKAGNTPLHVLCSLSEDDVDMDLLESMLSKGSANAANRNKTTLLHCAVVAGNHPVVVKLLAHGADANAATAEGKTPLHDAAGEGMDAMVDTLLKVGAKVELADADGNAALHHAAMGNARSSVEKLLAAGASAAAVNAEGNTALHIAGRANFSGVIDLLKDKTDLTLKNKRGIEPLGKHDEDAARAEVILERQQVQQKAQTRAGKGGKTKQDLEDLKKTVQAKVKSKSSSSSSSSATAGGNNMLLYALMAVGGALVWYTVSTLF